MPDIKIRAMTESDCAAVSAVVCESFRYAAEREGVDEQGIRGYVAERGCEAAIRRQFREYDCFVACAGRQIVGMVGVQGNEVTKLYVDPHCQQQGVGAMLLAAAERVIASAGHDQMVAWAAFDSAIGFYEVMGMCAVGRKWDILGTKRGGNPMLMTKKTGAPGPSGVRGDTRDET